MNLTKTLSQSLMLFAATAIMVVSCEKQKKQPAATTSESTPEFSISISTLETDLGKAHNDMLDVVAADSDYENHTLRDRIDIIEAEHVANGGTAHTTAELDDIEDAVANRDLSGDLYDYADDLYNDGDISLSVHDELDEVADIFLSTMLSVADKISDLESFETTVNSNASFSNEEKELLIGTSIIARYSLEYWDAANADLNDPWHDEVQGVGVLDRAWADVKGFVHGFLHGEFNGGRIENGRHYAEIESAA